MGISFTQVTNKIENAFKVLDQEHIGTKETKALQNKFSENIEKLKGLDKILDCAEFHEVHIDNYQLMDDLYALLKKQKNWDTTLSKKLDLIELQTDLTKAENHLMTPEFKEMKDTWECELADILLSGEDSYYQKMRDQMFHEEETVYDLRIDIVSLQNQISGNPW